VRHAERVPLGTTYPQVVERVRTLLGMPEVEGQCEVVVDATGVGAPVVDLLVTITGGEKETARPGYGGGHYNVPKRDLIASVQLALEKRELRIARNLRERETLVEELVDVRRTARESGREHRPEFLIFAVRCMGIRPDHKSSQGHGGAGRGA
jgi:hypothetical protein